MPAKVVGLHVSQGGVPKTPVKQLMIETHGCLGDRQNDVKHHGGLDKAVCILQSEIIQKLNLAGHPIYPGSTGENILISGINLGIINPGSVVEFPHLQVEITQAAPPCRTIKESFIDGDFTNISHHKYPYQTRWYAKVIKQGIVRLGDSVKVVN